MVANNLNNTISVIIRFVGGNNLNLLDQALFSLSLQTHTDLQVIIAIQNATPEIVDSVSKLLLKLPFIDTEINLLKPELSLLSPNATATPVNNNWIISVALPDKQDGRSLLINESFKFVQGRFIAFLDYDDAIYPNAYELLINRILASGAAVAVGGCYTTHQEVALDRDAAYYTLKKECFPIAYTGHKCLYIAGHYSIPIHSFVIDKLRISHNDLYFDTNLSQNEDHLFLLRLIAKYPFDFKLLTTKICEYKFRTDGSNTITVYSDCEEKNKKWLFADLYVKNMLKDLEVKITAAELMDFTNALYGFESPLITGDSILPHEYNSMAVKLALSLRRKLLKFPTIKRLLLLALRKVL